MHISNYHKQIQILCQLLVRDYKEEACSGQSMGDTLSGQGVSKEGEEEDERVGTQGQQWAGCVRSCDWFCSEMRI